jgi:hypothetical protein
MEKVLSELGWEQTYEGKEPPELDPEDEGTQFELLANAEGILGIRISEERVVRDLARLLSEQLAVPLLVFTTAGALFGRRAVEVKCRKFGVEGGEVEELPVMTTHTAEVTDIEHNELRQAPNALRQRIDGANDSMLEAEGSSGFKTKKFFRYKRNHKKIKWSTPRLGRLMAQIEVCESFEFTEDNAQPVVRVILAGGATSMAYLKAEQLEELEQALQGRPEIEHRRRDGPQAEA